MTHQAEECAMERLKNMSPVASLLETAEELGGGKDFVVQDHKAVESKCSRISESELKADTESSVPSEEASQNRRMGGYAIHTAVCKEVTTEPLCSGN
jgi:hypothetical protein